MGFRFTKKVILVLILILIFLFVAYLNFNQAEIESKTLLQTVPPIENKTIFLVHSQQRNQKVLKLSARQACAVESAAKNNPDFNVTFVTFNVKDLAENTPFVKALREYPNIKFYQTTLVDIAKDSIAERWMKKRLIQKSPWMNWHTSDFARYFLLYKYGGIYLDTDFIVLKSLADLKPGWTVAENSYWVAAAALGVHSTGFGHYVAEQLVKEIISSYNGTVYAHNGPGVITRVCQRLCFTTQTKKMKRGPCYDFEVLDQKTFYPIGYDAEDPLFNPQNLTQALNMVKDAYAVHCWGGLVGKTHLKVGTQAAIGVLAEQHCPKVYAAVEDVF